MLKRLVHDIAYRFGAEIHNEPGLRRYFDHRKVDLVLDVGANRGQYGAMLRQRGYRGRISSFEPVAAAFEHLKRHADADGNWEATRAAVGATPGTADINVTRNDVFSSILPASDYGAANYRSLERVGVEQVPMVTLDSVVEDSDAGAIFLKIDTQGFEKAALDGATRLLGRCVGLQLEIPVERLYEGVWTFPEAMVELDALGFAPAQFHMVNSLRDDPASAVEFDCVFRRKA
jgi:FkbM family methyltransferase